MSTIIKKLAVGESDFKEVISGNYYYVDKSLFIKDIIDRGNKIILIPRPRRFGKTLNISMLKYYYDCCPETTFSSSPAPGNKQPGTGNSYQHLFDNLAIKSAGREYTDKMGQYPVIFLTFKDIKESDWETSFFKIKKLIQKEYLKHDYLLNSNALKPQEVKYFKGIIDLEGNKGEYESSLEYLLIFLNRYYGKQVVILIDEYDAPVHAGFNKGYYDEIIGFTRNFLSGGLKDTGQYLEKGVLTGILRLAKESIFSGLNNPGVFTLLSEEFDDKFGFTEKEIEKMLKDFNVFHMCDRVRNWYNGYTFGKETIYNPWSITNFLSRESKEPEPYWVNTSDNQLVETLLTKGGKELQEELEQLVQGESIEKAIEEDIVLKDVLTRENLLWSFLLMGGYLKQSAGRRDESAGKIYYSLSIPNKEVRTTYTGIIDRYFTTKIENKKLEIMLKALVEGNVDLFGKLLRQIVAGIFSYHDFGGEPEKVYHALVTGLLVWITGTHEIKSNRESGYGRYDISIIPRDTHKVGYVIEFKTIDAEEGETVESAAESALKQIADKKYETELIERGIANIKKLAIVFSGKEVFVKE
ncbi:MAG TPA: AAA family ATPase [Candidatus Kapabacteria bacterium]|nr:AAA family ATPase [Candidatus Kapabacteria bacterium]